ncbi:Type IV pilus biogenesis protein PilM [Georgfuchsia toluolica]|uniref:Type IV pilus biogenesis protein PilM n=1 Tax=Georgfuchsia toluolica TaxID=424218 RepID=A0A916N3E6_9PROT|nr:pilus assembly protein PilM [Georgfuchsia toluolica]CAG4884951.1 Type IV pilus biogenesis protein PilM [Georgfuchsia toluolica]
MQIDLSIFNPSNRPLIGLDISSSSIKMVELSRADRGGMKVERYAIELLPHDAVVDGKIVNIEAITETIEKALRRMGTNAKLVAMALPTAAVITKKIILPAHLREQEMEVQVESEANQYIPFALEEVNLDFQVMGPAPSGPDEVEVLLAASRKEMVDDRVACALGAKLKAWVMDIEAYAAQAAFELVETQLPAGGRDQCIALVDVGANVMNVTMMRNDQTLYNREQAFGGAQLTQDIMRTYGMSGDEAEAAKRSGSLPDNYEKEILGPFLESMAQEVARALQFFFTSTQYTQIDHIVLSGGCATLPNVSEAIFAHTQVNTVIANPFTNMTLASRVKARALLADAPSLMIACGLALRRFDQ